MFQVPLYELYEVMASCQYHENATFCPVLLRINDRKILEYNDKMPFLLQIWTVNGEMVFEKSLKKPVANWNISDNKLVYMEENNSKEVFLVKVFVDKEPVIFKFNLPANLITDSINSQWDPVMNNFVI